MKTKNRNILYGYKFENGCIVIEKNETKIVKQIFVDYIHGQSFLKIANQLMQKGIEYFQNNANWNKSKIKRIIEDKRYLGDDKHPQIIDADLFTQANSVKKDRDAGKNTDRSNYIYKLKTPVICSECHRKMIRRRQANKEITEKWICTECGHSVNIFDSELIRRITDKLNYIILTPSVISSTLISVRSNETIRTENEINRMLETAEIDKDILQKKIFELVELKYADLDSAHYITEQIKCEFENAKQLTEISLPLLFKTTEAIQLNSETEISLILKNGQIIGKDENHATENSQIHSTDNNNTIRYEESISSGKSGSILPSIYKAG